MGLMVRCSGCHALDADALDADALDADALDADATPRQGSKAASATNLTGDGGSRGAVPCPPAPGGVLGLAPRHDEQCGVLGFAPRQIRCLNPKPEPGNPFRLKKQPVIVIS